MTSLGLTLSDSRAKAAWLYDDSGRRNLLKALLTDGTLAMLLYRRAQSARGHHLAPVEMVISRLNGILCGCIIGRGADFRPGFVLIHVGGIVINGAVRGGERVHLEHQVTIGAERRQSPVLGLALFVGAGAKIIGPIRIGDHARVGANAVVLHDVPPYATVVGMPASVVS